MIARLLVVVATVLAVASALGLAAWLELDRSSGTPVFVPVEVWRSESDLIHLALRDPLAGTLDDDDDSDADVFLHLVLDPEGRVVEGSVSAAPPAPGTVALRVRDRTIAPMSTRLPVGDHEAVRYLRLQVTPAGEGYEAGLADQDLQLLGRADRVW